MTTLIDSFGRVHRDLRVSLTDRCSLRCSYCMPAEGMPWIAHNDILSTNELVRVIEVAVDLGIEQIRLTGGEPLLRPDVVEIVGAIASLPQPPRISLTTNGIRLPSLAAPLADAGLERVNISLDTLKRDRFLAITRRDRLVDVLAGVAAAKAAGLAPVKINAVLLRDVNDDEAVSLLRWALHENLALRFIEQMPLDAQHLWDRTQMITGAEILTRLGDEFTLTPIPNRGAAPAEDFLVDGGPSTVGIIASVTSPFCGSCDRLRLTADGQLRSCLFSREESDLRTLLRAHADEASLAARIRTCVAGKQAGHGINDPGFLQPNRSMSAIGG